MFTRYKGSGIPENYSGVRFREAAQHTEMKTHKPSPSYTSTKTSVSPMFHSAQLQRNHGKFVENGGYQSNEGQHYETEPKREDRFWREGREENGRIGSNFGDSLRDDSRGGFDGQYIHDDLAQSKNEDARSEYENIYSENDKLREGVYEKHEETDDESEGARGVDENKKAHRSTDLRAELGGLLDKVFRGIKGDDFILLAVIFLLLGGESSEAKSALLPLALLLLYS